MQAVPRIPKPLHSVLCGGFFFLRFPGAPRFFTNVSHFVLSVVLQQHHFKPSQQYHSSVSKAFQDVLLKFPYSTIFLSFCAICQDYPCIF